MRKQKQFTEEQKPVGQAPPDIKVFVGLKPDL